MASKKLVGLFVLVSIPICLVLAHLIFNKFLNIFYLIRSIFSRELFVQIIWAGLGSLNLFSTYVFLFNDSSDYQNTLPILIDKIEELKTKEKELEKIISDYFEKQHADDSKAKKDNRTLWQLTTEEREEILNQKNITLLETTKHIDGSQIE